MPAAPGKPFYISSTDTSITLGLDATKDNGGNKITTHKLFRDEGNLTSDIDTLVSAYDGSAAEFTVTGLSAGMVYRFAYFAENDFGASDSSQVLTIASTSLPEPPVDL